MTKRILCCLLLLVLWVGAACAESAAVISSLDELNGKRVGVATGTTFDGIVRNALPEAKIVYINTAADLIAALETGKIDGFAVDEPAARQFCRENTRLAVLDEYMDTFEFGFVLPKTAEGEALLEELDAWITSMKENGRLEQLIDKWTNGPEEEKTLPDYDAFPAPKGKLTLVTEGDYVPMTYYRGNRIVGAEIDLAAQFCEACGYGLQIKVTKKTNQSSPMTLPDSSSKNDETSRSHSEDDVFHPKRHLMLGAFACFSKVFFCPF